MSGTWKLRFYAEEIFNCPGFNLGFLPNRGRQMLVGNRSILSAPIVITGVFMLLMLPFSHEKVSAGAFLLCLAYLLVCYWIIKSEGANVSLLSPLVVFVLYHSLVKDVWPTIGVVLGGLQSHAALREFGFVQLDTVLIKKLLFGLIAIVAFWGGYRSPGDRLFRLRTVFCQPSGTTWKVLVLVLCSCLVLFFYAKAVGGFSDLLLERGRERIDRYAAQMGGHYAFALHIGVVATLFFYFCARTPLQKFIFLPAYTVSILCVYLATGSRSFVVTAFVMLLLVYFTKEGRLPYVRILVGAIVLIAFIGVGGEFRKAQRGAGDISDVQVSIGVLESVRLGVEEYSRRSSHASGEIGIIGRVPSEVGFIHGETYLAFLAAPIPRAFWQDKPRAGGYQTALLVFGRDDTAIPPGNVGELYLNFGLLGVVFGMFLFGLLMRILYNQCSGLNSPFGVIFLVISLAYLQPNTESMNAWLRMVAILIFVAVVFSGLPRFRR